MMEMATRVRRTFGCSKVRASPCFSADQNQRNHWNARMAQLHSQLKGCDSIRKVLCLVLPGVNQQASISRRESAGVNQP
jgi:hypothetical protein